MAVRKIFVFSILVIILLIESTFAQNSGRIYRRSGVLNGNQVKTVFGNFGVIGQPATGGPRGAWIFDTNGYIGDVSPLVGAEVIDGTYNATGVDRDTLFHWVIDVPVARPSVDGFDNSQIGTRQAFEPVFGYFNPSVATPAISSNSNSWPASWPDKSSDFDGFWNGLFGKQPNADLETYFVMDDNNDNEFSTPAENAFGISFKPDPDNPARNGLGLEMKVRGLQWQQILAQDNIFWLYEVTNNGKFTYPRTVFGMLVGTYVGVTGAEDGPAEYDDDYSFFDVNEDLTFTGDYPNDNSRNPFWQGSVGLVGYAFLESPGNPFDGIDNDNDAASPGLTPVAPLFVAEDFNEVTVVNSANPGNNQTNKVVSIVDTVIGGRRTFQRTVHTFPADKDTFVIKTLGETITLIAGETKLIEGNVVRMGGEDLVNENAFDGKDNDLDGLIDENYFLHYRQRRVTSDGDVLFDILNPVRYIDFVSGVGESDGMIDERRNDGLDNDEDWSRNPQTGEILVDDEGVLLDDVGVDGIPNTGDLGENDGFPTPGEPNFDQTDKDESDQIGLSSFDYFVPSVEIPMANDEEMWQRMRPGFFDVPESFVNGRPTQGEDGDFVYSSGYFPLTPGQTERMSLALIYAWTLDDMIKKLRTVQKIYNSDYRFPIAPDKPTLTAVAGSDSVVLYWDRKAERSFDPVLREFDFEGYKIYRATDPSFLDAKTITNSKGDPVAFQPIAQFDYANNISGYFYPPSDIYQELDAWAFYLGDDTDLSHTYVDYDVKNGQTYYYAVVSYDRGVDSTGVIPSECTKKIDQANTGEITLDINTARITPSFAAAGYVSAVAADTLEHVSGDGSGTVKYNVIDQTALTGNDYEVFFWDTSNDSIDNNNNGLIDQEDPVELQAITTRYAVKDLSTYKDEIFPVDTSFVELPRKNLVPESVIVMDGVGNVIPPDKYIIDYEGGKIRFKDENTFADIAVFVQYQYHPVYFSPYMQGTPWLSQEVIDADIFDGLNLVFDNIWRTSVENLTSSWNDTSVNFSFTFSFETSTLPDGTKLEPVFFPSNYELQIFDSVVDTTTGIFQYLNNPFFDPQPRKFKIVNTTGDYKIEYFHADTDNDSLPSVGERIYFFEKDGEGNFTVFTWLLRLVLTDDSEDPYVFKGSEILFLSAKFPFNKFDILAFQTEVPKIDKEKEKTDLDNIKVYPNPYIAANEFEPALPPNVTSGRGERKIFFSNLPLKSKIHIFTARGDLVRTLEADNPMTNGTVTWDLKTRENLDIAFGIYFYVVESDAGIKRGKLAVIK
jgi:hypothetical protein